MPSGFVGDFQARRVQLASPNARTLYTAPVEGMWNRLRPAWWMRRGRCGHRVWEFEAHKPASAWPVVDPRSEKMLALRGAMPHQDAAREAGHDFAS